MGYLEYLEDMHGSGTVEVLVYQTVPGGPTYEKDWLPSGVTFEAGWRRRSPTQTIETYRLGKIDTEYAYLILADPPLVVDEKKRVRHADFGDLEVTYAAQEDSEGLVVIEAEKTS